MLLFGIATIINVILSTVRSLLTIKGSPLVASIANAVCYGFYTWVIVLTANGEVDLITKILITAGANFLGVLFIKLLEKKMTKDKLWKIEFTVLEEIANEVENQLRATDLPYKYDFLGKHRMFSVFCKTQGESEVVSEFVKQYNAKFFVTESKTLKI